MDTLFAITVPLLLFGIPIAFFTGWWVVGDWLKDAEWHERLGKMGLGEFDFNSDTGKISFTLFTIQDIVEMHKNQ